MIETRYHDELEELERSAEKKVKKLIFENLRRILPGIELTPDEYLSGTDSATFQDSAAYQEELDDIRAKVEAEFAPIREKLLKDMQRELSEISPSE